MTDFFPNNFVTLHRIIKIRKITHVKNSKHSEFNNLREVVCLNLKPYSFFPFDFILIVW